MSYLRRRGRVCLHCGDSVENIPLDVARRYLDPGATINRAEQDELRRRVDLDGIAPPGQFPIVLHIVHGYPGSDDPVVVDREGMVEVAEELGLTSVPAVAVRWSQRYSRDIESDDLSRPSEVVEGLTS